MPSILSEEYSAEIQDMVLNLVINGMPSILMTD